MNKKFSTLAIACMASTLFSSTQAATISQGTRDVTKIETNKFYQLGDATADKVLVMVPDGNGYTLKLKDVTAVTDVNSTLWSIQYSYSNNATGPDFTFVNKGTGIPLMVNPGDAPLYDATKTYAAADGFVKMNGAASSWKWKSSTETQSSPFGTSGLISYFAKDSVVTLVTGATATPNATGNGYTSSEDVYLVKAHASRDKWEGRHLRLAPITAGAVTLTAKDLNTKLGTDPEGDSFKLGATPELKVGDNSVLGNVFADKTFRAWNGNNSEAIVGNENNTSELYAETASLVPEITKANGYVKPQVYKDDQDLNNQLKAANEYCLSAITYTTPKGKEIALDGSTLITWLSKQDDGSYTKDESVFKEKLTAFVKELASQYNSIGVTRTFTGKDGQSHTVSGGTYGFRVSTDSEVSALLKMINENKSENNRIPEHTGQLPSGENGGLGTTYLEINITKQHLWFVKDGSVVLESDFVSGKESDPTRLTPSGTYYIYNKERNRVLRGTKQPNGKYEYESPVSYWMPFNKGIGLHDASWRSTFGRDIYINSGSHGCINLPTGFAGSLYSQIYVNLPVVVYR